MMPNTLTVLADTLRWLPFEVPSKVTAWVTGNKGRAYVLPSVAMYRCNRLHKTMTAPAGYRYDGATYAPNLRWINGERSHAFVIHDIGWDRGRWDDGTPITFDQNNANMVSVMDVEGFPQWVIRVYGWGISREFMRRRWVRAHGHP